MRHATVFLVWQSDVPKTRNKVKAAVLAAAKSLCSDKLDVEVDFDTRGESGSPDIGEVILRKIRAADVVVCDVTPVARREKDLPSSAPKSIPNPNVMLEAGYALGSIGPEKLVLVCDEAISSSLPFDIRSRRTSFFDDKGELTKTLKVAIAACLEQHSLPGDEIARRAVLDTLFGPGAGSPTVTKFRRSLSLDVDFLATGPGDLYARLSSYLEGNASSSWPQAWEYGPTPDTALLDDLKTALRPSSAADARRSAEFRILNFLDAVEIRIQLKEMATRVRSGEFLGTTVKNGPLLERHSACESIEGWLCELERFGLPADELQDWLQGASKQTEPKLTRPEQNELMRTKERVLSQLSKIDPMTISAKVRSLG